MTRIVIIGAGLSGLSAGAELTRNGINVTILEQNATIGGLAGTFSRDNYRFDFGPHILFGKKVIPELKPYFEVQDVLAQNNNLKQAIIIKDDTFRYPFQLKEVLFKMAKKKYPLLARDIFLNKIKGKTSEDGAYQSLEEWVKTKIGETLFDYIELETYVKKLYGISASEISSDWGKQKLKPLVNMSLRKSLNRNFNPFAKKRKSYTSYCEKGIGEIAKHLASYIVRNGGNILTGSTVQRIRVAGNKVEEVFVRQGQESISVSAEFFVTSMRIPDLISMIDPRPSSNVCRAGNTLRYRNLIVVYLVVDKPKVLDHCLMYFSAETTIFKRITDFRHFSEEMMPKGETILAVEICTNPGDEIWLCKDQKIFEKLVGQLEELAIISRKDIADYFTVRVPGTYPVYYLGYQRHLKTIFDYFKSIENLVSIGRGGLYQHDNMSTAMSSGFAVGHLIRQHRDHAPRKVNEAVYDGRIRRYENKF